MHNTRKGIRYYIVAISAIVNMLAAANPPKVMVYASVGEELSAYRVDIEHATLTKQATLMMPGFVQEAWASPSTPYLYVAWSNGGGSYANSGVAPIGDKHGITAFRIDPSTGALTIHGTPAAVRARPVHITGDIRGRHLLVAYNEQAGVSVHTINNDKTIGVEVPQPPNLDVGIYPHQVRVLPDNKAVILMTRGNQPTSTTKEDPGALKEFRYDDGKLTMVASIAPSNGIGFRARHLDFHPTRPWAFLTLESQNALQVYRITNDTLSTAPLFSKSTLANGGGESAGQGASTIHVHPNGQFVYVGNRNGNAAANHGSNDIAVFRINQGTGEPTLVANVDTHGVTPRTFSIDPSGRLLVVGNQTTVEARDGTDAVPANLAVFRIGTDGRLSFVSRYATPSARKPLWWMGMAVISESTSSSR
jgi:6-phosphogluconolactonase (cycloisomerase 2 family)